VPGDLIGDPLDRAGQRARWHSRLAAAAALSPVLIHGDLQEHQLLVADDQITGILDRETAGSITRSGISNWVNGAAACGASIAPISPGCGPQPGGTTRRPGGSTRTRRHWRPRSGCGRR
jgi:hypothetical protein